MTREEIKNTPELVDFMLDKCVLADSRTKVRKRLEEVCDLAIKALEQEPCDDCISRQYLLNNCVVDKVTMPYVPVNKIKEAPPVTSTISKMEKVEDCVSRQNIIDTYKSCADMLSDEELKGADLVMEWVNNASPVTPSCDKCAMNGSGSKYCDNCGQKSGKWIVTENGFECSECGCISRSRADFCQYCGAKMESEDKE